MNAVDVSLFSLLLYFEKKKKKKKEGAHKNVALQEGRGFDTRRGDFFI
jgi:hypothetical protein